MGNLFDVMHLITDTCILRSWMPTDVTSLVHHANNYHVSINLRDSFPHPYTLTDAQNWVQNAATIPNTLNLAIEVNGQAVGGIGLVFQTDIHRLSAEIGYWLGEAFWNKGIVTGAVKTLSAHAFRNLQLVRLYAGVFASNQASGRVLQKAGYTLEAIHKQAIIKNGSIMDEHLYVLLHPDNI